MRTVQPTVSLGDAGLPVRVLGIDPGIALCGYGIVEEEGGELNMLVCGAISTPARLPLPERLCMIHEQLSDLIVEHEPDTVAVEKLFFTRNVRTAFAVGQAKGVVLLAAAQSGKSVFEYTPQQVKSAITGYGSASKSQVQEMVRMVLGLEFVPQPDDAADAVAVAVCHIHSARLATILSPAQP